MLLQIHDELVFEIPNIHLKADVDYIQNIMHNIVKLSVPLLVNAGMGENWAEAQHGSQPIKKELERIQPLTSG